MRRGSAFVLSVLAAGLLTPSAFGQYPYPYGPMPVQYAPMPMQYAPPYGYAPPMPAYAPNQMMPRPMYYQPAPMMQQPGPQWQMPQGQRPNVVIYGPLEETVVVAQPPTIAAPAKPRTAVPVGVKRVQDVTPPPEPMGREVHRVLPTFSKADIMPDGCGPDGCGPQACGPACEPHRPWDPPLRGRGHFIGEIGAYFLYPYSLTRTAYTRTSGGAAQTVELGRPLVYGPHVSFGYVFHTGWGARANYTYLTGRSNESVGNSDPTVGIITPFAAPFTIVSPSTTLAAGLGIDQFSFNQRIDMDIADIEVLRESNFLDTTFMFSFGARYMRLIQSYNASRTNPGGSNAVTTVALDREDLNSSNRFEGWGPTVSFEAVHPLCRWGLSAYGNVRGSFLFGNDRFAQNHRNQNTSVTPGGVATFTDVTNVAEVIDNRYVPAIETELGLQYGCRLGRYYIFTRAGAVYQHWWDVGNPTAQSGHLNFLGGTAKIGVTF